MGPLETAAVQLATHPMRWEPGWLVHIGAPPAAARLGVDTAEIVDAVVAWDLAHCHLTPPTE